MKTANMSSGSVLVFTFCITVITTSSAFLLSEENPKLSESFNNLEDSGKLLAILLYFGGIILILHGILGKHPEFSNEKKLNKEPIQIETTDIIGKLLPKKPLSKS